MKVFSRVIIIGLISFSSLGEQRTITVQKLIRESEKTTQVLRLEGRKMTRREILRTKALLKQVREIALGKSHERSGRNIPVSNR